MPKRFIRDHATLLLLAVTAVCVVVTRACLQSITIDEATSYLLYSVKQSPSAHWYPASGNHVLNSLLMRLVTLVFGVSELTVRIPALMGALIYIGSALCLCLLLTSRKLLHWALFVALVYNPLILDYLVAARGYGLAIGFLLAALALIGKTIIGVGQEDREELQKTCGRISALLGLSFAANFSFAIADSVTLLLFFLWVVIRYGKAGRAWYARLAAWCFLPGIMIAFFLCGSVLLNWPKGQLYFGSNSLWEMWDGLMRSWFDELNPNIVNPLLIERLNAIRPALPYIAALTLLFLLARIEIDSLRSPGSKASGLLSFTRLLVIISVVTVLLHWLAFLTLHLLLPKDRTALFFVPLWTLVFGAAIAVLCGSEARNMFRSCGLGVLILTAGCFIGSLRLGYFKEWKWDANTKQVYWILDGLHRRCGITDFVTDWRYNMALNFYREAYGNYSLKEFAPASSGELPTGKTAYAIFSPTSEEFIRQEHLELIYHNHDSATVVAIRPCPPGGAHPPACTCSSYGQH